MLRLDIILTKKQNLQILSDCNRVIAEKHISDDPLETGKQYGVIQNGQVKVNLVSYYPSGKQA